MGYRKVVLVDITYCKIDQGTMVCYHIEFYDPFMDKVLGQATSETMDTELVKAAYEEMIRVHGDEFRNPGVFIHSDNGSQLLETSFTELLHDDGFIRSVSRPGTPGDNRPMEAKFSRLKGSLEQLLLLCKTAEQAGELIREYINDHEENDRCLSLGGLSPNQFEEYILTGVYPLDSYYGIPAEDLHPVSKLIEKLRTTAKNRTERAKKERSEHAQRLQLIRALQEVEPAAAVERDRASVLYEKVKCQKDKQAIDTDLKVWEIMDGKVAAAVSFIKSASPEVLQRLKDRSNWKDYPELQYINDFPEHRNGKMVIDHKKLGKGGISGPVSLWLAVEDFLDGVVKFFETASEKTRKLLEDPENWDSFPELSFLNPMYDSPLLEDGAGI